MESKNDTQFMLSSMGLDEAAEFLGFKNVERLRQKAKNGQIPGAFKVSRCWRFYTPILVQFVSELYATYRDNLADGTTGEKLCQYSNRKVAHTTTQDLRSAELEYTKLRAQLLNQKPSAMKKSAG
jgi:hypothetical protein